MLCRELDNFFYYKIYAYTSLSIFPKPALSRSFVIFVTTGIRKSQLTTIFFLGGGGQKTFNSTAMTEDDYMETKLIDSKSFTGYRKNIKKLFVWIKKVCMSYAEVGAFCTRES